MHFKKVRVKKSSGWNDYNKPEIYADSIMICLHHDDVARAPVLELD